MKILIADGSADLLEALAAILPLHLEGAYIVTARNGKEAVFLITDAKQPFDIVLTGYEMPLGGGINVVRTARTAFPRAHIVFMSGVLDNKLAGYAYEAGANDCLSKPFRMDTLAALLKSSAPIAE